MAYAYFICYLQERNGSTQGKTIGFQLYIYAYTSGIYMNKLNWFTFHYCVLWIFIPIKHKRDSRDVLVIYGFVNLLFTIYIAQPHKGKCKQVLNVNTREVRQTRFATIFVYPPFCGDSQLRGSHGWAGMHVYHWYSTDYTPNSSHWKARHLNQVAIYFALYTLQNRRITD